MDTFDLTRAVVENAAYSDGADTGAVFTVTDLILPRRTAYNKGRSDMLVRARIVLPSPVRISTRQRMLMDMEHVPHIRKGRSLYKSEYPALWGELTDSEWIEHTGSTVSIHCERTQEIYDIEYTGTLQLEILTSQQIHMSLRERAAQIMEDIPVMFRALAHKDTPLAAKVFCWLAVAYALSPIDLIPDFIPVLGKLDDILIVPMLIGLAVALIPDEVMEKCRAEAENERNLGSKKNVYAFPVIVIWVLLLVIAVWIITGIRHHR